MLILRSELSGLFSVAGDIGKREQMTNHHSILHVVSPRFLLSLIYSYFINWFLTLFYFNCIIIHLINITRRRRGTERDEYFPIRGWGVTGPPLLLRHGASGSAVSSVGPS